MCGMPAIIYMQKRRGSLLVKSDEKLNLDRSAAVTYTSICEVEIPILLNSYAFLFMNVVVTTGKWLGSDMIIKLD